MVDEITLYNFAGRGDIINTTAMPRLIKRSKPNVHIRICCRERDKCFWVNNPFIDSIEIIEDGFALAKAYTINHSYNNLGRWKNEVNTWVVANPNVRQWQSAGGNFCLGSGFIINNFFGCEIIKPSDNLMPELFYTEEEIEKANKFIKDNSPYIVLECESFSGQYEHYTNFLKKINTDVGIKIFTSIIGGKPTYPFYSLNEFNLKEVGLIIAGAECFYGVGSGMTVVSFERSLNPKTKRVIDFGAASLEWYNVNNNLIQIPPCTMAYVINDDLAKYKKEEKIIYKNNKNKRILWVCDHPTFKYEEINLLSTCDIEVIPIGNDDISSEDNSCWYDNCSMPDYAINQIRTTYLTEECKSLINKYIDCIYITSDYKLVSYFSSWFSGKIVYKVFGSIPNAYTDAIITEKMNFDIFNNPNYIWSPIFKTISDAENSNIKNNEHVVGVFVSPERLSKYKWSAENSINRICEVLSDIRRGYYKLIYNNFKSDYSGIDRVILGKNPINDFNDETIIGTLDNDTFYNVMAESRVLVYTGKTKLHLHYHPLEAITIGVPILYSSEGSIANECKFYGVSLEEQKEMGMFDTIEESRELINRCFNDIEFAKKLANKQKIIVEKVFSKEKVKNQIKELVAKINGGV